MSRRAVVIGGGLAGMLAAAVLSAAGVDEVVVVDRDELPEGPEHRKGLPQGRHAHLLMAGGMHAMEELLPGAGLRERLLAAGAHEISLSSGMLARTPEGWLRRWRREGPAMVTCSRALLDWVVRSAVREQAPVRIRKAAVVGLTGSAERVRGVRIAAPGGDAGLDADLVVDASGRGSRVVSWLDGLGLSGVRERAVDSGLVNASRMYRVPAGAERFPLTIVQADPYVSRPARSAMVMPIEGGRWLVSCGGSRGGEPPADPEGFLRYTLDLPDPIVGRLISGAEPLTDVHLSRSTSNVRRYLEKLPHWPEGFVVLGDALATFNPAYGHGMSVAAFGARVLDRELSRAGALTAPGLARRVLRGAARSADPAWSMAVGQDVLYPGARGGRPTAADRVVTAYTRRMMKAATGSYAAASAIWDVTSLRTPPTRMFHPGAVLAALAGSPLPPSTEPPLTPGEREVLRGLDRTGV
ncbi:FAD-dependent monooxygenase [Streptomyces griseoloalbus]|uniref:2-polyprenyl-6-methoxyphenol hydroxylase-like FAD-dependent oxidoreductase n=1 Tax=Streptomyces griseoloalbus TaxID=67303 RepID=A0A7W8BIB6_9ACTN|nr:FAD-dependent monooxygenase [Streptomyces albaduncus]MBB5123850.1 2-polyprenyl-6-methoxyphenol hydroxylase-like FAD-dependent oxidoreductase [Streptomyces albaduncus]